MAKGADILFDDRFLTYFGAQDGAFSIVSDTEAGDGQVTLTGQEKRVAIDHLGKDYLDNFRGNVKTISGRGLDPYRKFRHFPTGEIIEPGFYYPKPLENELRLYFSDTSFKVSEGDYWGIFVRDGELWLCSFSSILKNAIETNVISGNTRAETLEPETDNFQELVNSAPPGQVESVTKSWLRDPCVSQQAMAAGGYVCELFPDVPTFISKRSGMPFQEAHHLIPMREQAGFHSTLDTVDNVCVLSPYGHRMVHHAPFDTIIPHLRKLISARPALLERHGLLEDDLISLYR